MNDENKPVKIAATAFWASLNKPNIMSGKFQIDLSHLSDSAVRALEAMGLEVKQKDEQGMFITCKSNHEIKVYDKDKNQLFDNVGNGSKVVAVVGAYDWTFKNKKGKSPAIKGLVVTELIRFEQENPVGDIEEAL